MNRVLFGGRYSSAIALAAPGFDDLRPAPLAVLVGRAAKSACCPGAGRLSCFSASCASNACFRSEKDVNDYTTEMVITTGASISYLSRLPYGFYEIRNLARCQKASLLHRSSSLRTLRPSASQKARTLEPH
jgi:hypothetical protein